MSKISEINEYRQFTKPAELHKAANVLNGIISGIAADQIINSGEISELLNWCMSYKNFENRHPFNEIIPIVEKICEKAIVTDDEIKDLLWVCNNITSDTEYYDLATSSMQFLNGLVYGILADGVISDTEIMSLKKWIADHEALSGCYPFDEIESLLMSILSDGIITDDERNMLKAFLMNFVDLRTSYNLSSPEYEELKAKYSTHGICAMCQELDFEGNTFCFTGQSAKAKRSEIASLIESIGGHFNNNITNKTRYLIVGNEGNPCWAFSCYGRKIEEAENRRKKGQLLTIVNELDFWDIINDL